MATQPYIGQLMLFAGNFAPQGWAKCDGQILAISQNSALFSLLGTTYGGDGQTSFGLPDLRGRFPAHVGTGPGLNPINWGERGGIESKTLHVTEIPSHSHVLGSAVNAQATTTITEATATASATGTAKCQPQVAGGHGKNPTGALWATDAGTQSGTYSNNTTNPLANMHPDAIDVDVTVDSVNVAATTAVAMSGSTNNTGAGQQFSIRNPYLGIYFVIALQGLFPSQ